MEESPKSFSASPQFICTQDIRNDIDVAWKWRVDDHVPKIKKPRFIKMTEGFKKKRKLQNDFDKLIESKKGFHKFEEELKLEMQEKVINKEEEEANLWDLDYDFNLDKTIDKCETNNKMFNSLLDNSDFDLDCIQASQMFEKCDKNNENSTKSTLFDKIHSAVKDSDDEILCSINDDAFKLEENHSCRYSVLNTSNNTKFSRYNSMPQEKSLTSTTKDFIRHNSLSDIPEYTDLVVPLSPDNDMIQRSGKKSKIQLCSREEIERKRQEAIKRRKARQRTTGNNFTALKL